MDLSINSGSPFLFTVNTFNSYKVTPNEYWFEISSSYLICISFTVTWILSRIFVTIPPKYPFYCSSLSALFDFLIKSCRIASQKLVICCFLASMILWFLHYHKFCGSYVINNYRPSITISILLDPKLFQGMVIFKQPSLEYLILSGKFSFLMISLRSLTFLMTTSPDQRPIFIFSALKSSTYSLSIGFNIFYTIFSNILYIIWYDINYIYELSYTQIHELEIIKLSLYYYHLILYSVLLNIRFDFIFSFSFISRWVWYIFVIIYL